MKESHPWDSFYIFLPQLPFLACFMLILVGWSMITREDSFESVQSLPFPTGLAVNLGDGGGQNV